MLSSCKNGVQENAVANPKSGTTEPEVTQEDNGALPGLFSVAEGVKVRFAKGNLQYTTAGTHACADGTTKQGTWRFAEHQYDYVGSASQYGQYGNEASGNVSGSDNADISSSYTGWIDLFGCGTSGYNVLHPYMNSTTVTDYCPSFYSFYEDNLMVSNANYDWGVYNAISNGGNVAGKWRTLTNAELTYLCFIRTNAASKNGHATVNGVHGVVFLPDSWTMPAGCTFFPGNGSGWTTNSYTTTQWAAMESAGALFLPAAGYRDGITVNYVGSRGEYWHSMDRYNRYSRYACGVYFNSGFLDTGFGNRYGGYSVRLVCE